MSVALTSLIHYFCFVFSPEIMQISYLILALQTNVSPFPFMLSPPQPNTSHWINFLIKLINSPNHYDWEFCAWSALMMCFYFLLWWLFIIENVLSTTTYHNYKSGIEDPDEYFTVPDYCLNEVNHYSHHHHHLVLSVNNNIGQEKRLRIANEGFLYNNAFLSLTKSWRKSNLRKCVICIKSKWSPVQGVKVGCTLWKHIQCLPFNKRNHKNYSLTHIW